MRKCSIQTLVVMLLLTASTHLAAQPAPDRIETAEPGQSSIGIHVGQTVWITTQGGSEQKGQIAAITPARLELEASGRSIGYSMADVVKIEARDSVWNGARNGAIVGGVAGGVFFGLLAYSLRCETNCGPSYSVRHDVVESSLALGTMSAIVGGLSGALIDRAIEGRRLVYSASPRSSVFRVAPILGRGTVGIRACVLLR